MARSMAVIRANFRRRRRAATDEDTVGHANQRMAREDREQAKDGGDDQQFDQREAVAATRALGVAHDEGSTGSSCAHSRELSGALT
ncbi:MAG: hypothetical protein ACI85K_002719 [Hyphomicrobiaceae bacterium]|jgi:hypothetical protein